MRIKRNTYSTLERGLSLYNEPNQEVKIGTVDYRCYPDMKEAYDNFQRLQDILRIPLS